jgi:cation diffusion facilitator CzcD-associated flavoprotein CzcO
MNTSTIHTDLCIIGAGPVGLFAVFEAGLLKMRCHLIDALPQIGGQLSEIYPQKPIYDIPGYPEIKAQDLVDNLMEQARPLSPGNSLHAVVRAWTRWCGHAVSIRSGTMACSRLRLCCVARSLCVPGPPVFGEGHGSHGVNS